jgi:uncharacterized protein YbjQ (UPF0145 family)
VPHAGLEQAAGETIGGTFGHGAGSGVEVAGAFRFRDARGGDAKGQRMIVTTTASVEGRPIAAYLGVVSGESIIGANLVRDLFARVRDIVGGRAGAYEKSLQEARATALTEMSERAAALGADAVVGVSLDIEAMGDGDMILVAAAGTAVRLAR